MTFQIHLRARSAQPLWSGVVPLTEDMLVKAIAGAAVRSVVAHHAGEVDVVLDLEHRAADEALRDLEVALEELGFDIVEALIVELTTALVEGALLGALGGTAAGMRRHPAVLLACVAIGTASGAAVGRAVAVKGATYLARRAHDSWQWSIVRSAPQSPTA